jgi:hypothetical protein
MIHGPPKLRRREDNAIDIQHLLLKGRMSALEDSDPVEEKERYNQKKRDFLPGIFNKAKRFLCRLLQFF